MLEKLNLIAFYRVGKNKYVVINPKYYAKFYNIRFMYAVEYCFEKKPKNTQRFQNIIKNSGFVNQSDKIKENGITKGFGAFQTLYFA